MDDYQSYLKKIHDQLVTPDELIKDIVKEAANKGIRNKSKIIAGEVSEVYDIELDNGQQIIIRMNPSDQKIYFQEQWAIEQCKKIGGIPVPEILLIKHIPKEDKYLSICVMEKINGDTLERGNINFDEWDEKRKRKVINSAGEILARIHTIQPHGFGYLKEDGKGQFETFKDLMSQNVNKVDQFLRIANEVDIPVKTMEKVFTVLNKKLNDSTNIPTCLVHSDYNVKHIMVNKNDVIVGIIDWGDIQGHSPVRDFSCWYYWFDEYIPTQWLIEGYSNKQLFNNDFQELVHWLKLDQGLEILDWYHSQNYTSGVKKAVDQLKKDILFFS